MTYTSPTTRPTPQGAPELPVGLYDRIQVGLGRITSDPLAGFLAMLLAAMTVLSAQALHPLDHFVNTLPRLDSLLVREFLIYWPDTVASRAVALPVLGLVALFLALRSRSYRPIVLAAGSVVTMICLVAAMKVVTSRSHPRTYDPSFFVDFGQNFSFPSGHGANAILIYGVALYLIVRYRAVRPHIAFRLSYAIVLIAVVQAVVSTYLQFHWATDLMTGMVAGALVLRMTILVDRMIPEGWTVGWWPFVPAEECVCTRRASTSAAHSRRMPIDWHRPASPRAVPRGSYQRGPTRPLPSRPAHLHPTHPPRGEAPFPPPR